MSQSDMIPRAQKTTQIGISTFQVDIVVDIAYIRIVQGFDDRLRFGGSGRGSGCSCSYSIIHGGGGGG